MVNTHGILGTSYLVVKVFTKIQRSVFYIAQKNSAFCSSDAHIRLHSQYMLDQHSYLHETPSTLKTVRVCAKNEGNIYQFIRKTLRFCTGDDYIRDHYMNT